MTQKQPLSKQDFPAAWFGDFRPAVTKCRCPKCHSGTLWLTERVTAQTEWEVIDGRLNRAGGMHEATGTDGVVGRCQDCGHKWRVRNAIQITCVAIELDSKTFEPLE